MPIVLRYSLNFCNFPAGNCNSDFAVPGGALEDVDQIILWDEGLLSRGNSFRNGLSYRADNVVV